ncbi:hypothetical protein ACLOJK_024016 [Asimina triloba]
MIRQRPILPDLRIEDLCTSCCCDGVDARLLAVDVYYRNRFGRYFRLHGLLALTFLLQPFLIMAHQIAVGRTVLAAEICKLKKIVDDEITSPIDAAH